MNTERILQVADAIEQHTLDLGFNMQYFVAQRNQPNAYGTEIEDKSGHDCGTCACIGGWVQALAEDTTDFSKLAASMLDAGEWLGLGEEQSWTLFYAANRLGGDLSDLTQEQAVRTLRHLAVTGDVDWTV